MTICAAAFAEESKVIVCVADKAVSYGEQIQWDSDSSKMLKLHDRGPLVMFSGSETHSSKILAAVIEKADGLRGKKPEIIKTSERIYKEALDEFIEARFLTPRLLRRGDYLSALTAPHLNDYILEVAREIGGFEMNCDLLICGFDVEWKPFILDLSHPGIVTDMTHTGFAAIGSGWEKAVSRLLFSEHKREHPVSRVLYDAFDCKAFAEMSQGVGFEWDAVITMSGVVRFCDITQDIKDIVEKAWAKFSRSPFEKRDPKKDLASPPANWKRELERLMESQVITKLKAMKTEMDKN